MGYFKVYANDIICIKNIILKITNKNVFLFINASYIPEIL